MNCIFFVLLTIISSTKCLEKSILDGPQVVQVTKPLDHAEGPSWDVRSNLLYFVDLHEGAICSLNYFTGHLNKIQFPGDVTPVVQSKETNLFYFGWNRSLAAVEWDGDGIKKVEVLSRISDEFPNSRFNDGKADRRGRLWLGTMGFEDGSGVQPNQGILYRFTKGNLSKPSVQIAPVNISNGLAWNFNNTKLYYIDSSARKIVSYEFEEETGDIKYEGIVFDLTLHQDLHGVPDGMTIDEEDNLWVALYGGGLVIKVCPETGKVLQKIVIPAEAVTSVMFGGPNLDVLFVTTSRFALNPIQRLKQPGAGSVFAVFNLKTKGLPVNQADLK